MGIMGRVTMNPPPRLEEKGTEKEKRREEEKREETKKLSSLFLFIRLEVKRIGAAAAAGSPVVGGVWWNVCCLW